MASKCAFLGHNQVQSVMRGEMYNQMRSVPHPQCYRCSDTWGWGGEKQRYSQNQP